MTGDSSNSVANSAIELIGGNIPPVAGNAPTFDNSTAGLALQELYEPAVWTVGRQFGWDFARNTFTLASTGNTPLFGWTYEYAYPSMAVEVWQLLPAAQSDPNNPQPQLYSVYNTLVGGVQTKVIGTNIQNALAVINNNPTEATWDALFREAVVRLLASELSMALFGKPDASEAYLNSGAAFEQLGETRMD